MQDASASTTLATITTPGWQLYAAQFLARYGGTTRATYATRLKSYFTWCTQHDLDPITEVTRPHLELYGRWLEEERHNCPASVHGALSTIKMFYRLLALDGIIPFSPAEHVRMPKVYADEIKVVGLSRNELTVAAYIAGAA